MSIFNKIVLEGKTLTKALVGEKSQKEKTLILMRGLPGSGKSTTAKTFGLPVYSTDDYFLVDGKYVFDGRKLIEYHDRNFKRTKEALAKGLSVVVDNCNVELWEMKRYVEAALENGYRVQFQVPNTSWRFNCEECAERCTKSISLEVLKRIKAKWQPFATVEKVLAASIPLPRILP